MERVVTQDDLSKIKGIAVKVYKRYYVHGVTIEDLEGEGRLAFIKGFEKYNPETNNYYWGFVYKKVQGAMIDYIRKLFPKAANECAFDADELELAYTTNTTTSADDEIDKEYSKELFMQVLPKLTPVEQCILYDYYIELLPVYKIAKKYVPKHSKVKKIIENCSKHLKEVIDGDIPMGEGNFSFGSMPD